MNKIICTLVTASVLVGGYAYGQNKPKTQDKQGKQALRDSQMDEEGRLRDVEVVVSGTNVGGLKDYYWVPYVHFGV